MTLLTAPAGSMPDVALSTGDRAPLVGRADELQLLLDAVAAADAGRPSVVLLGGDAGVGKTRLLQQLLAEVPTGAIVLRGGCVDLGDVGLPYLPFAEVVADLVREVPAVAGSVGLAPLLPGGASGGELARLQLFEAFVGALRQDRPVVVVLEDLHWSDASSRELLRYLVTRLRDERVAVLASYRADDLHRRHPLLPLVAELARLEHVHHLELAPLADDAVRRHVAGLGLPADRVEAVVARAEGNAYFAEELTAAVLESGRSDLPTRLSEVLLSRLERLAPSTLSVVRLAAVAGRRVEHELLAAACAQAGYDVDAALREAVAAHVLVVSPGRAAGSYAFRHALLQETVYDDLLPGERVRLHALLAEVLTAQGSLGAGELGFHLERSGDTEGALRDYLAAATASMDRGAPHEALALRLRALELVEAGAWPGIATTERADLLQDAADAAGRSGDWGKAIALDRALVDVASALGPAPLSKAHQSLAVSLLDGDREAEAQASATLARSLAVESGDRAVIAQAEALYARVFWHDLTRDAEVAAAASAALQAAEETGQRSVQADALVTLGLLAEAEGAGEVALDRFRTACDVALAGGHLGGELRARFMLAAHSFYGGDLTTAAGEVDQAVRRAELVGLSWSTYGYSLRTLQVVIRYTTGDLASSSELARVLGGAEQVRESLAAVGLYAAVARGDDDAIAHARRVASVSDLDVMAVMIAAGTGADALRMAGSPAEAVAMAEHGARRVAQAWGEWSLSGIWLAAQGIAALADLALDGRDPAALDRARRWEASARQTAVRGRPRGGALGPEGRAWLLRATAELSRAEGRHDVELWRQVRDAFDYGYPYEVARSRWRLAEALVGAGDRAAAEAELREAASTARALGTRPLLDAVESLARRARLDVGQASGPRVAALTGREAEVLGLVVQGLTNRQIGERLFMSEKTASVHVSRILAKLEVSGRTEAAAKATQLGLV